VRVGLARRVDGGWREVDELRLDETDFWRTSAAHALCRLALGTAGTQRSFRPYLTVQVLLSPSLGCGRAYRIPLPPVRGVSPHQPNRTARSPPPRRRPRLPARDHSQATASCPVPPVSFVVTTTPRNEGELMTAARAHSGQDPRHVADHRKWFALALLCAVQFMVVLDVAIVNVALPSIQTDLGFSQENLQWVISAYALVFGGFLLLGGRLADIVGRRGVFMGGLVVFSTGSLLCGLAWSDESLIAARALQGLGAAMVTPSALSILTTTFTEGRERNIALGAWGAVGGFGAAGGVLAGGILTDLLSWEWIFFVNLPVGVAGFALAPVLLSESRDAHGQSHDVPGAVLVTSGLVLAVLGITQGRQWGWGSLGTIGVFISAGVLLVAFALWEQRQREPLVPFSIFRLQTLTAANVAGFIMGTALFSMFLMLTLYMQQVLEFSPLETGIGYLAVAGTAIVWANVAAAAVTRVGVKPALVLGMSLLTVGLLSFTQVSADGSYWVDLFPGFLILGFAIPFAFVPITIAALAGTKPQEAGLASGLINTSQQIGGAVGIAVLSTIAVSTTDDALASGNSPPAALTDGFVDAFWAGAAIAFVGVLVSLFLVRGRDLRQVEREPAVPELALDEAA
jgi:EmrB/QacA subfamily drug resistance transporter